MKCTVDQSKLSQILNEANRFVANKALNPILSGLYLEVRGDTLSIISNSGQSTYQSGISCSDAEDGVIVVPASLFFSVVKSLDSGEVTLEQTPEVLRVIQKKVDFTVTLMTTEDFPLPEVSETETKFVLPLETWHDAAEKVLVAASKDETKPVLTSLLFEMSDPNALVTSDGFRLYRSQVDLSLDQDASLLLPARWVKEALTIFKKREGQVVDAMWNQDSGQVRFSLADVTVTMSQVVGDFPNYRAIIPENTSFAVTVDRELLQQRLQQVMVVAREVSSIVVFLQPEGSTELSVASQESIRGKSAAELATIQVDGEVPVFACNGMYVLDFLSSIDSPEVVIQGTDPLKPIVFTVPTDPTLLYLVMPFKLQQ